MYPKSRLLAVRKILFWTFAGLVALAAFAYLLPAQAPSPSSVQDPNLDFRVETVPVPGGAEIVTIFGRRSQSSELPLVSVLRDTLGDNKPENDRLRYVWLLSYTEPSFVQKASAFVPFLYARTTNKKNVGSGPPPKIADMHPTGAALQKLAWLGLRKVVLGDLGFGPRASFVQYRQNTADYRRSAVARALTVLSVSEGEQALSDAERRDITARLAFNGRLSTDNLGRGYSKQYETNANFRSQNWELLRQYSEAQGLYFEPLKMPDGTARHAIVWAAVEDLAAGRDRKYDPRFLNIKNPWTDSKLRGWKGYTQRRWFDADGRGVDEGMPEATARTLIPLAIYGLDHPKVPAMLIDFRDNGNAKRREMSRRIIRDITGNLWSPWSLSSVPYLMGRRLIDFLTGRRGIDFDQPSRMKEYSQLKLLLSLDTSLDEGFRADVARRLEHVSLNPLENDLGVEAAIARKQYDNLMDYAKRPDGLPAKLDRMRREEMVKIVHGPTERAFFKTAHTLTFGLYTHREKPTPQLVAEIDTRRQLEFHERRLVEIARNSVDPEVDSDVAKLSESLTFISANGSAAKDKTVRSLTKIYAMTSDADLRNLCLAGLYRINNASAKNELLAIYDDPKTDTRVRGLSARYLKLAAAEGQRISSRSAAAIAAIGTD